MIDSHEKQEKIFADALVLQDADRTRFLDRACAGDEELKARILRLLGAHLAAGDFLAASPVADVSEVKPGTRIGRYRLVEKIGEGGVGVVFLAEQEEPFRRNVALKVIKPGMDTREVIARFESERQALALMDHPNIARVFDAGAIASGRPYFVMELVIGLPITKYCDERGLTIEKRVELFAKVASAIQHAHARGIIHRDLKPSNILVTAQDGEGVPKIIDFGIAKAMEFKLTEKTLVTGFSHFMGTPPYLSPEQAEMGGREVDARSDIYSLGVVLYELLTGRAPFDGRTLAQSGIDEIRRRIRDEEPPRPSVQLNTLDGEKLVATARQRRTEPAKLIGLLRRELDWVILRCLEKDRERRYPTASALAADLQCFIRGEPVSAVAPSAFYALKKRLRRHRTAVVLGVAVAVTMGAVVNAWVSSRQVPPMISATLGPKSIAVLAFEDLSAERGAEYFSDGFSEELLNVLAKVPGLRVAARTSSFFFKGKNATAQEIGRKLAVAHIVEGSVRRVGSRVRIAARLSRSDTGEQLWSESYDRQLKEVLALQAEIARDIAEKLQLTLGTAQRAARTVEPEAHRLVLEGRHFWNLRSVEGLARAEAAFVKAVVIDPQMAPAHAGLADVGSIRGWYRLMNGEGGAEADLARAKAAARRAIELDDRLAEPFASLGIVFFNERRFEDSEKQFRRAFALNPNYAFAHAWHAILNLMRGRLDMAQAGMEAALRLDPLAFIVVEYDARILAHARRFEEALASNERAQALRPEPFIPLMGERARILLALGRRSEAVDTALAMSKDLDRIPRWSVDSDAIRVLEQAGLHEMAADYADRLFSRVEKDSYVRGMVLVGLGRFDEAIAFLERTPPTSFQYFYWHPAWDPWRDDPRFQQLLVKLGCAEEYKVARATLARLTKEQEGTASKAERVVPNAQLDSRSPKAR